MENKIVSTSQSDEDMSLLLPILKRLKEEAEPLLEQVQKCEIEFAELQKNCSEIENENIIMSSNGLTSMKMQIYLQNKL